MLARKLLIVLSAVLVLVGVAVQRGHTATCVSVGPALHVDIATALPRAKVALSAGHDALNGDMPIVLVHAAFLVDDFGASSTDGQILAIFHTDAAHMLLDDRAYNAARHISTGNPYKTVISGLMNKGVKFEMCGATARAQGWSNDDLLPGVKVDTDAMIRLIQLGQEGWIEITE